MKKLIITATITTAIAISGFSQGQIIFQNTISSGLYFDNSAGLVTNTANKVTSAPLPDGGVVDVGLYWSTAVFTDAAQGTLADTVTMSSTQAGTIAGETVVLPGTSAGEQVYVQVFAWDSLYGNPDAALAANAFFAAWSAGPNNTVYGAIGAPELTFGLTTAPAPGYPIFGTAVGQFGRAVMPTPEPATITLGGLGAAALLMFRRRK
jgi:hypothetical protein